MKKLLLIPVLLCASLAFAQGAFVQGAGSGELTGTSESLAFGSNNTAGNTIIILWRDLNNPGPTTNPACSDSQSNTYIMVPWGYPAITYASYQEQWYICYSQNIKGGANTVTTASTGSSVKEFYIGEYSGLSTNEPLEVMLASANVASGSTPLAMSVAAQRAGMLISCAFSRGGSSGAPSAQTSAGWSSARYSRAGGDGGTAVWDQVVSSAGQFTNNVTNAGGTPGQFNGLIVYFRSALPTVGFLQSKIGSVSSATSLAITLPFSVTSGSLLTAAVTNHGGAVPSGVSGCSGTWNLLTTSPSNDTSLYYAMNAASGACTVTATFSGSQTINISVAEYAGGTTTFAPEVYVSAGRSSASVAATIATFGTNDIVFSVVADTNNGTEAFAPSTGYSQRSFFTLGSTTLTTSATFDLTGGANSYTNTVTGVGSNMTQILVAFRSALPTLGRLQYAPFTTSTSQAYPLNNGGGNLLLALCRYSSQGARSGPTDTAGNTWVSGPAAMDSDSANYYILYYAVNSIAGANTVTESGSGGNGIQLFEYTGLDTVAPLAGASAFFSDSASSSMNAGPVPIFSSGVLFSVAGSLGNSAGTITYTGGTSFVPFVYSSTDNVQVWDRNVTSGTYSNAITASGSMTYQNSFTVALSSVKVTYAVLQQHNRGGLGVGGDGSISLAFNSNVKAGDLLITTSSSQGGSSTGTISDTQGNTWNLIKGGGSNLYGFWWAVAGTSGADTITNTNVDCLGIAEFANFASAAIDQTNSATQATATSSTTGNITTTQQNELLISTGYDIDVTNRLFYTGMGAGWSGLVFSCGGHYAASWLGYQTKAPIGTYTNTFTWANSMTVNSAIASFTGSILGGGTQPTISIITDNMKRQFAQFGN